jgi:hypothetical protein
MDFWNDDTTFVTQKNENCGLKKYGKVVSKCFFKNHQMKNLLVKCIETFLVCMYILFLKALNYMIVINFYS